ncbi:alpha/beta hydrolase family protein [Kitasatospora sp. NPDC051853]|uniref:alpha/beta hydrolase family protein n=1 Tax=Kitasatospora sp. NPDC051853 TaxID=3364058 RepID=UPI0037B9F05B
MNRRLATTATLLLALALPLPLAATASAAAAPSATSTKPSRTQLELPRPTGPLGVGREVLHLVDRSRVDQWAKSGPRELMVTMYYPARHGTGRPAPYMQVEEARRLLGARELQDTVDPAVVAATRTAARTDARPLGGTYPLVVLSPGFGVHRATLSSLAEDLTSRGYLVALVDHAYESVGTAFPGGRLPECLACDQAETVGYDKVTEGRAKDVSFLLDRLTGRHPAWRHAGMIDRRRIAMAGHSIGGASAASAMAADPRIRAGVDMDGSLFTPAATDDRPFLLLGAAETTPGHEPSWDRDWSRLGGWKRWITFTGSGHFTFTDYPALGDQLGLPDPDFPLSGARSVELTRRYVGAFLDLHLKGRPQPLLDGPRPDAPEVLFHTP